MSNFKPLSERVAAKLATELKTGVSVFQRPANSPNSAMPFNIETGNRYPGASALILLMQKREDPRWATFNQANRNRTAVLKGASGTYINFSTQYEYQPAMKDGEPVLTPDKKPRYDKIRLDEPKIIEVKLFNGEQLRKLPKWEKESSDMTVQDRAEAILAGSGVKLEHGGDEMVYHKESDTILLPEPEQFANHEQYVAEALHQLLHRELENQPERAETSLIKDELRTNIASLFLTKEIGLPFELNYHDGFANSWAQLMKEEPGELFNAAEDAQQIVDKVLGYENVVKQEQSEETGEHIVNEAGQETGMDHTEGNEVAATDQPRRNPKKLDEGEIIPYNGKDYLVEKMVNSKNYQVQDLSDERVFNVNTKDQLYKSLLDARNNSQEVITNKDLLLDANAAVEHDTDLVEDEHEAEQEEINQYMGR